MKRIYMCQISYLMIRYYNTKILHFIRKYFFAIREQIFQTVQITTFFFEQNAQRHELHISSKSRSKVVKQITIFFSGIKIEYRSKLTSTSSLSHIRDCVKNKLDTSVRIITYNLHV